MGQTETALAAVHATYCRAKYADRHYPERFRCEAWVEHLRAITHALRVGVTGRQIQAAQREVMR